MEVIIGRKYNLAANLLFIAFRFQLGKDHSYFMRRCIEIAQAGLGYVSPNPLVGSVIVKDGKIISEGFHRAFGGSHAEVNAIESETSGADFSECTLYVNLEPCSHFGKTPPCADLIIRSGFKKVVIGTLDPNPIVSGRGVAKMQEAGIEIEHGIESEKCEWLNRRFFTWHREKRPYVILKWAQTKDGFMDKSREIGEKGIHWISSPTTKRLVHIWRSEEDAILIGGQTMAIDNPSLTVREVAGKNPLRVVLAGGCEIPKNSSLLSEEASTLFIHSGIQNNHLADKQVHLYLNGRDSISFVLKELYERNIQSVIIEGGKRILEAFIDRGLWDEARVIESKSKFLTGLKTPEIKGHPISSFFIEEDQITLYKRA
ncbi:MAG: bifunctional diaminohydroxyphosphoribosylaminopyrimidine deaminase/5-amino-6-(5-phosphoribosylamino)uracil reductase RibD [Flavobacteriales bacterium]